MADLIVVLGGTRSGKSGVGEALVAAFPQVVYVATAADDDDEMRARIKAHVQRRPAHWTTVESTDLAGAVATAPPQAAVLVDGVGTWLARRLSALGAFGSESVAASASESIVSDVDALVAATRQRWATVVVVAEEVGMSLVPADAGSRLWVDALGTAVQRLSEAATRVLLVHAGRAVDLPPPASPSVAAHEGLRLHGDTMVPAGALDFAVNIHGDGPADHLRAVVAEAAAQAGAYPDAGAATTAVAARHSRNADEVLLTAGAAEAFWTLTRAVTARHAVVVHPQFTEPEAALRAAGIGVSYVYRRGDDGWRLPVDEIPDEADLVVVGAPNNPTGTLDPPDDLAALCRSGRITVVDEAFADFVVDPSAGLASRADLPGLVVVRSVTKLWGLAGIRAGYAVAPAGLVARCRAAAPPWNVSTPALRALEVCATDEDYRRSVAETVREWRTSFLSEVRRLPGVTAWDSAANFVLLRVPNGAQVHRRLAARGVIVRPSTFPGLSDDHLRVAVRPPAVARRLVDGLREILADPDA